MPGSFVYTYTCELKGEEWRKNEKNKNSLYDGPSANDAEMMRKLIQNGMDVARFNFSHGTHEEQKARMDTLKKVREEERKPVAILLDTKGPEIRTGLLKDGKKVTLEAGKRFVLSTVEKTGDETGFPLLIRDWRRMLRLGREF